MNLEDLQKENELLRAKLSSLETRVSKTVADTDAIKEQTAKISLLKRSAGILSAYAAFLLSLVALMMAMGGFDQLLHGHPFSEKLIEQMHPVVRMLSAPQNGVIRVADDTDFTPTFEERFRTSRLNCMSIPLSSISLDISFINSFFRQKGREKSDSLRFRVGLKSGVAIEGALIRDVSTIAYSRVPFPMDIPVDDVQCFRKALHGEVYGEYIGQMMHQARLQHANDNLVASTQDECLTDDEACDVFRMVCAAAVAKIYDWDRVFNICFLGTWDRDHPWLSVLSLIVLGLLFLVLNVFIRPLIIKVGQWVIGTSLKERMKKLLS